MCSSVHQGVNILFETEVTEIEESRILLSRKGVKRWIENDMVFTLIGYTPDTQSLRNMGVEVGSKSGIPVHSPDTFETNIPGLFVCGSIAAGNNANSIFIENGKLHGEKIIKRISR